MLEGPTSTVVWAAGGTLHTPPLDSGILPGTTMARLFERAAADGWPTAVTPGTVADLHAADAVWLMSGVRGPPRCTPWTASRAATRASRHGSGSCSPGRLAPGAPGSLVGNVLPTRSPGAAP